MRIISFALVAAFTLGACEQQNGTHNEIGYGVTGVAPNDTLAMRAAPDASATIVGAIPHNGEGILAAGGTTSGGWSDVAYQGKRGWVNARFLGIGNDPSSRLPALLECLGTEPFWRITLSPGAARADLLFIERGYDFRLTYAASAMGRSDIWTVKGTGGKAEMSLKVKRESCSDGMSDTNYPYSTGARVPSAELIAGCCRPHQPR